MLKLIYHPNDEIEIDMKGSGLEVLGEFTTLSIDFINHFSNLAGESFETILDIVVETLKVSTKKYKGKALFETDMEGMELSEIAEMINTIIDDEDEAIDIGSVEVEEFDVETEKDFDEMALDEIREIIRLSLTDPVE